MRWIVVVATIALLTGCYWFVDDTYDPQFDIPATGATTPQEVCSWVIWIVGYLSDKIHDKPDYWQSPDQTYEWRRGDCEDYVLLVMYLIHRDVGGWPEMVLGSVSKGGHAWLLYEGREYEVQTRQDVTDDPDYVQRVVVSYGVALWRSMNTHKTMMQEGL